MTRKYGTALIILLVVIIAAGGILIGARSHHRQPIEITMPPAEELSTQIYIGGAVANPGLYPLKADDSIEALLQAAGGATAAADPGQLRLYLTETGEGEQTQKVNLNRAEPWLLEALPGIGEVRAQAIIDYRQQNGGFRNTDELTKVEGIGTTTYQQIKHLITVAD